MYGTDGNTRGGKSLKQDLMFLARELQEFSSVIPNAELIPAAPRDTRTALAEARRSLRAV